MDDLHTRRCFRSSDRSRSFQQSDQADSARIVSTKRWADVRPLHDQRTHYTATLFAIFWLARLKFYSFCFAGRHLFNKTNYPHILQRKIALEVNYSKIAQFYNDNFINVSFLKWIAIWNFKNRICYNTVVRCGHLYGTWHFITAAKLPQGKRRYYPKIEFSVIRPRRATRFIDEIRPEKFTFVCSGIGYETPKTKFYQKYWEIVTPWGIYKWFHVSFKFWIWPDSLNEYMSYGGFNFGCVSPNFQRSLTAKLWIGCEIVWVGW